MRGPKQIRDNQGSLWTMRADTENDTEPRYNLGAYASKQPWPPIALATIARHYGPITVVIDGVEVPAGGAR